MRANAREDISRFTSDLMEKENNRKAYLQGIVQACQAEVWVIKRNISTFTCLKMVFKR